MDRFETAGPRSEIKLREWISSREGLSIPHPPPPSCDYCGRTIEAGMLTSQYASTLDVSQQRDGSLMFQRHYCEPCRRTEITHPCRGVYEVLVEHRVTEDYQLVELQSVDVSPAEEGFNWSPAEVCEEILERPAADLILGGAGVVGPEDVVDTLALYGLPVAQVVSAGGEPVSGAQFERVKEQMEFVTEEVTFRDETAQNEWVRAQPYPPTGQVVMPSVRGEDGYE
jgi:hypothetical protein